MEENKQQLIELIKKSFSLNPDQKTALIKVVEELTDEERKGAIEVFLWEVEKGKDLRKKQDKFLEIMGNFAEESKGKMKLKFKKMLQNIEKKSQESDLQEMEKLLAP